VDWLPGARAAVLGRLWGALAREPIIGITDRTAAGDTLTVHFGQRVVSGDRHAAAPFAPPPAGFAVSLDGRRYDDPGALVRALDVDHAARFAAELDDSVTNLALARAAQPAPDGGPPAIGRPTPHAAFWEQLVVDGHPLHPGCRTRLGMSAADVRRYAPEHRPVVDLVAVPVPPARWLTTGAGLPPVLTLHPWQAERLGVDGPTRPARPLMSLRTLAPLDDPRHHLKTAIDAQLTSAVRTVSEAAVRNGPAVTAFLAGIQDGVTILREPAAGIVLGDDGRPDSRRAMVRRQAPPPGAIPLASLAAPSPADGRPLALEVVAAGYAGDPTAYLADLGRLLRRAVDLAERGVGLEAHGQNLLVTLHRGRPHRLYYRDVGGIRIHARTAKEHGLTLYGDLCTEDPDEPATTVRAAVGVVVGEQVAALARETGAEPEALWRAALPGVDRAPWPVKATTAMRLADDPLRPIWATLR
jgi:staphyloferrin A synthase